MDYTTQVINAAGSSHPVTLTGAERVPSALGSSSASARPGRHMRCRSYQSLSCDSFSGDLRRGGIFLSRNQQHLFQALSLQAVTADNDSEGSSAPGPSSSGDYTCIFQGEEGARQSLLQCIQIWYSNVRKQNLSTTLKEVLDKSKAELRGLDAKQVVTQLKNSKLDSYAVHWWQSGEPWIKWPFAIFVPWYLLVSVIYGISVSMDLLPLWILGPIVTGLVIKATVQLVAFCRQRVATSKLTAGLLLVFEEAKSGQLPLLMKEGASSKIEEVKQLAAKKKSDFVSYVESGQAVDELKQFLQQKFLELWERSIDKYEDFRLLWLALERKLKNII